MLVQHFLVHFQDCLHVTLLPPLPSACFCSLDSCSCPCYLHKSALLAAVLMTALVHCSHILRHVLLQKSAVLVAVPLRCSCDRLWSPFLFLFFSTSRAVGMCRHVPPCQPTLTMTTPAPNAKLLLLSGPWLDSKLTPSLASVVSTPSHSGATPPPLWASCWLPNVVSHGSPSNWMGLYFK